MAPSKRSLQNRPWRPNAAYQSGIEDVTGAIESGKSADFVVLDRNPLNIDPDEIRDIEVLVTVLKGEVTYSDVPEDDRVDFPGKD